MTSDTVISYFHPLSPTTYPTKYHLRVTNQAGTSNFLPREPRFNPRARGYVESKLRLEPPHLRVLPVSHVNDNSKCGTFIQLSFCRLTQQASAPRRCSTSTHNWTRHSTSFSTVKMGISLGAMVCAYGSTERTGKHSLRIKKLRFVSLSWRLPVQCSERNR
jgi:hypothetical protein